MHRSSGRIAALTLALPLAVLAGCAASDVEAVPSSTPTIPLAPRDTEALAELAEVAPRTSTINPTLADWTECWVPGEYLIPADEVGNKTTWKVICRIHWHQTDGTARYQDTNCIGDFAKQPMLDHCYRWVHYDLEPRFEDHPAVRAGG